MREIKFRQWIKSMKKFHYWGFIVESEAQSFHGKYFKEPLGPMDDDRRESQQYTGLKDKDGEKIYEGDIIKYDTLASPQSKESVEWNEDISGFNPFVEYDSDCQVYVEMDTVEILGNIYENPDLLKEK